MTIPTILQLYNQLVSSVESNMNITISPTLKAFLSPFLLSIATALWALYLFGGDIQKNIFVDTCDIATLIRYGEVYLGRPPYPAVQGKYNVVCVGTTGSVITAPLIIKSDDSSTSPGMLFILDTSYTLDGISNEFEIRALEAGDGSQLTIGDTLTFTSPVSGVDSIVTVTLETTQPQASENIEDYRDKVIESIRLETQGGAGADYRLWANEVQGIVQTYPYTSNIPTEVNLYIEADNPTGIPTLTDLQNVEDAIELPTVDRPARKPISDRPNYLPITPKSIDVSIANFSGVSLGEQADTTLLITNAITDYLADVRPFVDSIDVLAEKNDYFDTNAIVSIILAARPGSVFGAVTMTIDAIPTASFTFEFGDIPKLNLVNISYV